jgi:hypothetical protein
MAAREAAVRLRGYGEAVGPPPSLPLKGEEKTPLRDGVIPDCRPHGIQAAHYDRIVPKKIKKEQINFEFANFKLRIWNGWDAKANGGGRSVSVFKVLDIPIIEGRFL